MVKRYKMMRVKIEDYAKLQKKKSYMEDDLSIILGKKRKIPDTRLISIIANSEIRLPDFKSDMLSALNHRNRRKR